jgi:EmrB/QacA subfamily drug resistance transporter
MSQPLITRPRAVLVTVSLGLVLSNLDLFVVNVALPSIAAELRPADLGELSWILNAYAIVFAALLVPAGRLADRTSRRTGFLLGAAIFVVASGACAAATSVPMLIAFRVLQAIGAAALLPTSLGLVLDAYSPEKRFGAVRIWAAVGSGAVTLAPVVAGPLVDLSWRWVFLINLPVGLYAIVAGWRILPHNKSERGPFPDMVGAALLSMGVAVLTLALIDSGDWGWSSSRIIGLLVVSSLLIIFFFARSARHPSPVFELDLLKSRNFSVGSLSTFLFNAALGAMLLSSVLWVQDIWHWSALQSGLALLPGPALVPIWAVVGGKLIRKVGPGAVVMAGSVAFAAGLAWWAVALRSTPDYVNGMLGGMALTGIGVGLASPTLFGAAASSLAPARFATGSGVINMIRQIGLTVGVAMLVAITGVSAEATEQLTMFRTAWITIAGIALAAGAVGCLLRRPQAPPKTSHPDPADPNRAAPAAKT